LRPLPAHRPPSRPIRESLAAAINTLRDTYEGFDYALAQAKVAQMFALAFYREVVRTAGPGHRQDG
jgi:hypothetical protein